MKWISSWPLNGGGAFNRLTIFSWLLCNSNPSPVSCHVFALFTVVVVEHKSHGLFADFGWLLELGYSYFLVVICLSKLFLEGVIWPWPWCPVLSCFFCMNWWWLCFAAGSYEYGFMLAEMPF